MDSSIVAFVIHYSELQISNVQKIKSEEMGLEIEEFVYQWHNSVAQ